MSRLICLLWLSVHLHTSLSKVDKDPRPSIEILANKECRAQIQIGSLFFNGHCQMTNNDNSLKIKYKWTGSKYK